MQSVKKYGLTVMLALAIIISFVLSVILWLNPAYEHQKRDDSGAKSNLISRPFTYTYEPTQAIHTGHNRTQYLLTNSSVNVISEIVKNLRTYQAYRMDKVSSRSRSRYLRYLNRPHSVMLNYHGKITTKVLNSVSKGSFSHLPNRQLNHVVLPLTNHRRVYLLNDRGYRVYRVNVTPQSLRKLKKITGRQASDVRVKTSVKHDRFFVNYVRSVLMPQYEYLINKQTRNYNVMHLLNDNSHISRSTKAGQEVYSNGSDHLDFGRYRDVKYVNNNPKRKAGSLNRTLYHSYDNLLPLKLSMNGIHYFDYNPRDRTVQYRGFVEGFPIFNPTQLGLVSLHYGSGNLVDRYSLNSLQIPIPNERKRIRLPSSKKVLATLRSKGYRVKSIQAIELGYEWQNAKSSKILANLIPGWFVEYHHHWLNYQRIARSRAL